MFDSKKHPVGSNALIRVKGLCWVGEVEGYFDRAGKTHLVLNKATCVTEVTFDQSDKFEDLPETLGESHVQLDTGDIASPLLFAECDSIDARAYEGVLPFVRAGVGITEDAANCTIHFLRDSDLWVAEADGEFHTVGEVQATGVGGAAKVWSLGPAFRPKEPVLMATMLAEIQPPSSGVAPKKP